MTDIIDFHASHIGFTPITGAGIEDTLQTFVMGPIYYAPVIDSNNCKNVTDPTGGCVIKNEDKSKQTSYQNAQLELSMLKP